jgi:ribosomal protein L37AE/L43A
MGHMSNDPTVVSHCPFCGSGAITGGSDGTVDCSLCARSFIVMEQPLYSNMPSAEQGASVSALPSDPLKQEDPFEPGAEAIPPEDPASGDPAATDTAVPPAGGEAPEAKKPPMFATRSGALVGTDDFVTHHAVRLARGESDAQKQKLHCNFCGNDTMGTVVNGRALARCTYCGSNNLMLDGVFVGPPQMGSDD